MDLVHNLKGKIVVYCLECEPDAEGRPFRYVGCTNNCLRSNSSRLVENIKENNTFTGQIISVAPFVEPYLHVRV